MIAAFASGKFFENFIFSLKNSFGFFWSRPDGLKEYYLKLDGFFFCPKKKLHIAIIKVRGKRTYEEIPIRDILTDKDYLKELHPVDNFAIGLVANIERNGIVSEEYVGWQKMCLAKNYDCAIKSESILEISNKFINKDGIEIVVLRSPVLNKEIKLPITELYTNQALLYSLGNYQAVEIGYEVSESFLRRRSRCNENQ